MSQCTIHITNIPFNTTEEAIGSEFCKFGKIIEICLIKDQFTGQSKGICFITYSSQHESKKSLEMNGISCLGRTLKVTQSQSCMTN
ncbi:RNA binding protein, cold-inducible rrm [Legionella busanensis]|uniref:RNA binding protein, cold-inducible rrm n=1 Tax=Legionella busanensis TaxID=190655 RepID=A0A378KDV6_9GAMM|nr:RNA-binding protein [Legionella busanensis]STX81412.1 RNA binding protein, cold-inducible rrm [Legionella busanensis]